VVLVVGLLLLLEEQGAVVECQCMAVWAAAHLVWMMAVVVTVWVAVVQQGLWVAWALVVVEMSGRTLQMICRAG
jgi:hypothetical protein